MLQASTLFYISRFSVINWPLSCNPKYAKQVERTTFLVFEMKLTMVYLRNLLRCFIFYNIVLVNWSFSNCKFKFSYYIFIFVKKTVI